MIRFSLASLFLLVLFAAVGCTTLIYANDLCRQLAITITVAALLLVTVIGFFGSGRARTFAGGFSLVGWLYFVLGVGGLFEVRDDLLTDEAVVWLCKAIHKEEAPGLITGFTPSGARSIGDPRNTIWIWDATTGKPQVSTAGNFTAIGHSLWTVILACIGGVVAGLLRYGRDSAKQRPGKMMEEAKAG